jgi:hypothetical protein
VWRGVYVGPDQADVGIGVELVCSQSDRPAPDDQNGRIPLLLLEDGEEELAVPCGNRIAPVDKEVQAGSQPSTRERAWKRTAVPTLIIGARENTVDEVDQDRLAIDPGKAVIGIAAGLVAAKNEIGTKRHACATAWTTQPLGPRGRKLFEIIADGTRSLVQSVLLRSARNYRHTRTDILAFSTILGPRQ